MKTMLWYGVLAAMTAAYLIAMWGVHSARRQDVPHHSRRMMIACTMVGLWLIGYVAKQVLFGREQFGGTIQQYWRWYVPTLALHTILATVTIGMGVYNLSLGLTRLRQGTGIGAMVAGVSRHRFLGKLLVWTFTGTLLTAYMVFLMLFRWFPPT